MNYIFLTLFCANEKCPGSKRFTFCDLVVTILCALQCMCNNIELTFVEVDPRAHDDTSVMQTCCKLMHFRSDPVRRKNRKALLNKRRSTSQSPKGKKSMRKNGSSGTDSETERRFKGRRRRMSSMIRPKGPRAGDRPGQESSKIGDKHGNVPTDGWVEVMWVEVMFARFLFCLPGSRFICQVLVLFARFLFCFPGSCFVCQVLVLFASPL